MQWRPSTTLSSNIQTTIKKFSHCDRSMPQQDYRPPKFSPKFISILCFCQIEALRWISRSMFRFQPQPRLRRLPSFVTTKIHQNLQNYYVSAFLTSSLISIFFFFKSQIFHPSSFNWGHQCNCNLTLRTLT